MSASEMKLTERTYRIAGDDSVEAGRHPGQMGWYHLAATFAAGKTVLDVGCGMGMGLRALRAAAKSAMGQDMDERLASTDVVVEPISRFPDKSYDLVVCVDVIEHVEEDRDFLADLCRIARDSVFVSTPLSYAGRKIWPYHVREYRAREFLDLIRPHGKSDIFIGSPTGEESYPLKSTGWWLTLNDLINHPLTNRPARVVQKFLPRRWRNHAHQAALIHVNRR